jgi:hypothetical protein
MAISFPHDAASTAPPAFSIPRLRDLGRHALPTVIEGTVIPVVVFWLAVRMLGPWTALLVGLGWVYVTIVRRLVLRRRVPGVLLIAAVTATCRVVVALSTHSIVLYFLQPSVGTVMTALAFLVSAGMGRPLAARLAHDFCPLPDGWSEQSWVRRFFLRISLLWGLVFLANAAFTAWLALSQSVETIALARPAGAGALTLTAIGISVVYFRRMLHRHQTPAAVVVEAAR